MALAPIERSGLSAYAPIDAVARERAPREIAPVDRGAVDPSPVAAVNERPDLAPPRVESLTSSARAAAVALAAIPRDANASVSELQNAAAQAEDDAIAALQDPLSTPTPREVAENFAAVAALVPSPKDLANEATRFDPAEIDAAVGVSAPGLADEDAFDPRSGAYDPVGARLSRFA